MRFSLTLLALLAVAGCDSTQPDAPPLAPAVPLAVGTEWTFAQAYRVTFEEGVPLDTVAANVPAQTFTLRATRDPVVAGETWVRIETVSDGPDLQHCVFGRPAWFTNRTDGLYRWKESPADAELAYGVGVTPGVPFLDTDAVAAVLVDDGAHEEGVQARVYERTWRRLEFNDDVQGPIAPTVRTLDVLSPTEGPLALEVQYVRQSDSPTGFVPSSTIGYRRADL